MTGPGAGHMVARRARRSHGQSSWCTVAVKSSGLVGGRTEHAGFGGFPTKPSEDGFLVWASKPSPRAQHDGDGIRACREASKRRTCGGIASSYLNYLNAPTWVVSPVVKLG
jgi:hypothetical protein